MKTLIFEGAGWSGAEHNGVGNCRIRATFVNDLGETLYLELIGHETTKYSPPSLKYYSFPWHISHIFDLRDKETSHTKRFAGLDKETREYTKENILSFVNKNLNCSFESIEVRNTDWSGFSVDGKEQDQ